MMKELLLLLSAVLTISKGQIPGAGWCPDKRAMAGFDIDRYIGTWYEAERYFTVLEAGSRCARTNYTKAVDGRILVTNEITNRLTGIKRVLDGEIRNVPKGGVDSRISVKYSTLPFPMETEYIILDTDYDSYSVVWSCSGLGPLVNTQSAWVMTRDRLPPGTVLQKAYAVLDKHKISRTFFVRAEQEECNLGEALISPQKTRSNEADVNNQKKSEPSPATAGQVENQKQEPAAAETTPAANYVVTEQKTESAPTNLPPVSAASPDNVTESSSSPTEESVPPAPADTFKKPAPAITAAPPAVKPVQNSVAYSGGANKAEKIK